MSTDYAVTMLFSISIDGLVQEKRNSSALAMELRLWCPNPSISLATNKIYVDVRIYMSIAQGLAPLTADLNSFKFKFKNILLHPV